MGTSVSPWTEELFTAKDGRKHFQWFHFRFTVGPGLPDIANDKKSPFHTNCHALAAGDVAAEE